MINNKPKFLKNLLTTASALAILAGGANSAIGAAAARTTNNNAVNLNTGAGLNAGGAFVAGSTLQFTGVHTVTAGNINVEAINMNNNAGGPFTVTKSISIGSVVDTVGANKLAVNITNKVLTLNGTASGGLGFAAVANDYTALGDITFNANAILTVDNTAGVHGDITLTGAFVNGGNGTLNVNSNLKVKNVSAAAINKIYIDNGDSLTFDIENNSIDILKGTQINYNNADSSLIFNVDAAGGKAITLYANLDPAGDDIGKISFIADGGAGNTLTITGNGGLQTLGLDKTHRLRELQTSGDADIVFDNNVNIFAKSILIGGPGKVEFTNAIDSGANSQLTFLQDGKVTFNAAAKIETIDFNGKNAELKANALITGDVDNTTLVGANGTLIFTGANSGVTGTIGNTKTLAKINFNAGGNAIALNGNVKATVLTFEANDIVTAAGTIEGDIDFANNAGTFNADGMITGNVDSKGGPNGTLNFTGANSGVTGKIGNANAINVINVKNGAAATLANDLVNATTINIGEAGGAGTLVRGGDVNFDLNPIGPNQIVFAHADSVLKLQSIGGTAKTVTLQNNVDPGAANTGIVELHANGVNSALIIAANGGVKNLGAVGANTLKELRITGNKTVTIENNVNVGADLLNINNGANLVAKDPSVAAIPTINIGEAGGPGTLVLGGDIDFNLNPNAANQIVFAHADSVLKLQSIGGTAKTVTLQNNVDPGANKGIVELHANGANSALTIAGNAAKTLGVGGGGNTLKELRITGDQLVTIRGALANNVDLTNIGTLNIKNGAKLLAETKTVTAIPAINIGEVGGPGTLTLDATAGGSRDLLKGTTIDFKHADSILKLTHSYAGASRSFLLHDNLVPPAGNDAVGILEINSNGVAKQLILKTNAAETIGIDNAHRLNKLIFTGGQASQIQAATYVKEITIGSLAGAAVGDIIFTEIVDSGTNSKLSFLQDGKVTFNKAATIETIDFNGKNAELSAKALITGDVNNKVVGGNSTLTFIGAGGVTGTIGNTNSLDKINFNAGGNAIALNSVGGGVIKATTLKYIDADQVTAHSEIIGDIDFNGTNGILNANALITGNVDNTAGGGNSTLNFTGANSGITGKIGNTKALNEINVKNGITATLSKAPILNARTVNVGEAGRASTLILDATENDMDLMPNALGTINFLHDDSLIKFVSGKAGGRTFTLQNSTIGGVGDDNKGRVELNAVRGNLTIAGNGAGNTLGVANDHRLKELIISGDQQTTINNAVFTKSLTLSGTGPIDFAGGLDQGKGGIINVNESVTVGGNIAGTDTTIKLADKVLTYSNGIATLNGDVTVETKIKAAGAGGIGQIVVDAGSTLNLTGANTVKVVIGGISDKADIGQSYQLFKVTGGTLTAGLPQPTVDNHDANALVWSSSPTGELSNPAAGGGGGAPAGGGGSIVPTGGGGSNVPAGGSTGTNNTNNNSNIIIEYVSIDDKYVSYLPTGVRVDNSTQGLKGDFGATNPGIVEAFAGVGLEENNDAGNTLELFRKLQADRPRQQEAAERLSVVVPTEALAAISTEVIQAAQNSIGTRIESLSMSSPSAIRVSEAPSAGVAAGDEIKTASYGIWGSPFYSQATQKQKGKTPGYKSKSAGGTVGFDCLPNDNLTLGTALTFINSKFNHKDQKLGDTTKAESTLFSIYGVQQLPNNWFIQGIASFGSSTVRNYEKRIVSLTQSQIAQGKYTSTTYSGGLLGGYRYHVPNSSNATLTPMAGLNYARFNDSSYTETGTTKRNLNVSKKSIDVLEGVLGIRASMLSEVKDVVFVPEIHGFINYNLKGKAPKVDARLNGALAPMPAKTSKPIKTLYNLGTSLTLNYHMMEYGIGYDANLAKKYVGHQGTLKVRVNF